MDITILDLSAYVGLVAVGAIYQKHPQILLAHASQGYKSLADMKGKPIAVAQLSRQMNFSPGVSIGTQNESAYASVPSINGIAG